MIVSKPKKMPLTFFPHKWVSLKAALRRIMSITESLDRALHYLIRDLRSGRLRSDWEEISPDGKEMHTLLKPSYWQQRTVKATLNPEEGVWVEPYVAEGRCFVLRADLDKWYPTPTMTDQSDDTESSPPTMPASEKQKPGINRSKIGRTVFWRLRWCASPMRRLICCGIALSWSGTYVNF